jgi:hypothetical protein
MVKKILVMISLLLVHLSAQSGAPPTTTAIVGGTLIDGNGGSAIADAVVLLQGSRYIAQGAGEELMTLTPGELRRAVDAYLDKGPDFIKYGGTSHFSEPTFIGFSLEAQKAIVDQAHQRNRFVETHATNVEGLRVALAAGIDGIQHPEMLDGREIPDDLIAIIAERGIVCSMLASTITGPAWQRHLTAKDEALKKRLETEKENRGLSHEKTTAERRKEDADTGAGL